MTYPLQPDVLLEQICGEEYLIAYGSARGRVPALMGVSPAGAYFWRLLERGTDTDIILRSAARDYDISLDEARDGFVRFTASLREKGYLTEELPCALK